MFGRFLATLVIGGAIGVVMWSVWHLLMSWANPRNKPEKAQPVKECEHVWAIPDNKSFAWCKLCAKKGERVVPKGADVDSANLLRTSFTLSHPEPEVEKPEPDEKAPEGFGPPKPPEPKRIKATGKECQHDWFTPFNSSETRCTRCDEPKDSVAYKICTHTGGMTLTNKRIRDDLWRNVTVCDTCQVELKGSDISAGTKIIDNVRQFALPVAKEYTPGAVRNVIQNASVNGGSITQSGGDIYYELGRQEAARKKKTEEL